MVRLPPPVKTSCIPHPENEPLLVIRQWQLEATGDPCQAALLSFFTYWHDIKVAMRSRGRTFKKGAADSGVVDADLYQFHTAEELSEGLMGLYKRDTIRKALVQLEALGFISIRSNPNPRFGFDRTKHFILNEKAIIHWLNNRTTAKNRTWCAKNRNRDAKNRGAIPETSPEIPNETTQTKETSPASQADADVNFPSYWKPDRRTKDQKLASIRQRDNYPSEAEFKNFLEDEELEWVKDHRQDLYEYLCQSKWHHWRPTAKKWVPVKNWKEYVRALNDKMEDDVKSIAA